MANRIPENSGALPAGFKPFLKNGERNGRLFSCSLSFVVKRRSIGFADVFNVASAA
jgi:hypothetical protein